MKTVSVRFNQLVTTSYGETVFVVGSIPELGLWNVKDAVALRADQYTSSTPLWYATVKLPAGKSFEYKFVVRKPSGEFVWESDPNRSYTVSEGCKESVTVNGKWR